MMNRPMKPYKIAETPEITKVRKPSDNRKINVNFKEHRRSPKPANSGVTGKTMVCPTGLEPTAFRVGVIIRSDYDCLRFSSFFYFHLRKTA